MKHPEGGPVPSLAARKIQETIQRALASAGLDTTRGPMQAVGATIRRALAGGRYAEAAPGMDPASIVDVETRIVDAGENGSAIPRDRPSIHAAPQGSARFKAHAFSNDAGTRAYKVYVPAMMPAGPRALIVMLHGCTQSADDFAAGTRMNRLADEQGFLVVYPEQSAQANAQKCWSWFKPADQRRGSGEPSLIAGIVQHVAQAHGADPRRIFVAGLSAGAAMAVVLGETYPELFAGVGAHSGLPYGSAHDIPSAMAAMKGGRSGLQGAPGGRAAARSKAVQAVPVIVFHGDRDHTVQQTNGEDIALQAQAAHARDAGGALHVTHHRGVVPGGRAYSRAVHADAQGRVRVESWTVHGAGHAWSGGHASGSYTDGAGPDASAEMLRFFMALPHSGSA